MVEWLNSGYSVRNGHLPPPLPPTKKKKKKKITQGKNGLALFVRTESIGEIILFFEIKGTDGRTHPLRICQVEMSSFFGIDLNGDMTSFLVTEINGVMIWN